MLQVKKTPGKPWRFLLTERCAGVVELEVKPAARNGLHLNARECRFGQVGTFANVPTPNHMFSIIT
jgi:hypothetical protein